MTQYISPKPNWLKQSLWWSAGADPILLRVGTYSDQIKMACMGGTVVSTAILAFFAGTYAIHTIFSKNIEADITFAEYFSGFIWALIIFNIDRFIVSSSAPNIKISGLDKFKNAIPRIIMGVIISLIISKPLELKIFEKDIELEISKTQGEEYQKIKDDIKKNLENDSKIIDSKLAKFENEMDLLDRQYAKSDSLYKVELRIVTVGPRALALKADREKSLLDKKAIKNDPEYKDLILAKDSLNESINVRAEKEQISVQNGLRSLVNKIKLSHKISPTISNMITLLFIILELTPIFFKILMEKSPYDSQMFNRNKIIRGNSKILFVKNEKERERIKAENIREQEDLQKQFMNDRDRENKEADLRRDSLLQSNEKIINSENDIYLKNSLYNIIDLEKAQSLNQKMEQADKYAKEIVDLELEVYKRNKYFEVEKELTDIVAMEYKNIQKKTIENNPEAYFKKLYKGNKIEINNTKPIQDSLIKNKFWTKGENFSYIKILPKNEITKILHDNLIELNSSKIDDLYNNDVNKIVTDTKIAQSKNGELLDWMKRNGNVQKYNLDEVEINRLHSEAVAKIIGLAKKIQDS